MNIMDVKTKNTKAILSLLRFSDGLSKRDIAQQLDLSFSTVCNICDALRDQNILEERPATDTRVGRVPKLMRLRHMCCLTVCLNFQLQDTIDLAIFDLANNLLLFRQLNTSQCHTMEEQVLLAHDAFLEGCRHLPRQFELTRFIGVGVSVSGVFDKESRQIVNSAIHMLENQPVTDTVERVFGLPCHVNNEANLCAVAMSKRDQLTKNLLYLHLSQGAGAGIICEGKLLQGYRGYAAEISHIPLGNPQRRCPVCSHYGCIEPELCVKGLVETCPFDDGQGTYPERWKRIARRICEQSDEQTQRYIQQKGELIGMLLSILVNLFDPQTVYVGGEITDIFPQIEPILIAILESRCIALNNEVLTLRCDTDSDMSIVLGLNQVIFEKWNPLRCRFQEDRYEASQLSNGD